MNLQQRIEILEKLGNYILSDHPSWIAAKEKAHYENNWFIPEFIEIATNNIANKFLQKEPLNKLVSQYAIPATNTSPKRIGIVMAGNIPLVGFHDFMTVFLSGHSQTIKLSSKDNILLKHLVEQMLEWNADVSEKVGFSEMLKGCDAYITTGSNNSARYFEHYFGKYPHLNRKNRTSVAILTGNESPEQLSLLADDVYLYFGLGCRNVTKIYVPKDYDFLPLLTAFRKYNHIAEHNKYKNNYDYQLAVLIINRIYYMTNDSIVLKEDKAVFSPISQLNYEYYSDKDPVLNELRASEEIQCIVGEGLVPFGYGQQPGITDFADGSDSMKFLLEC